MKSLEELNKLREEVRSKKEEAAESNVKITIAMGTCGIAAGARDVSDAILDELEARDLEDVTVTYTGCIGLCQQEPLVKVKAADQPVVLYGNLNAESARKVVAQHIVNNQIISEWSINNK